MIQKPGVSNKKTMNKYKKLKKDDLIEVVEVLSETLDKIQFTVARHISAKYRNGRPKSAIHIKNLSYHFIPHGSRLTASLILKARSVLELNRKHRTYPSYKFLDAGCGAGNVMLLAFKACFSVYGLEIDPTTIAFAEKLEILPGRGLIKRQNILTYKDYSKYDVIYFFRPIINELKQREFENRLKDQMKIGAILIPILAADTSITRDKRFKRIHVEQYYYIYLKVTK